MADESNRMSVEAQLEAIELDPKPERRGYESLRGVRRSNYFRRSLLRMLSKAPEELEAYSPRNMFESVCRNMLLASNSRDRGAAVAVAVFRECQSALGEKISVTSRQTAAEERQQRMPVIINDLPMAIHKPEEAN